MQLGMIGFSPGNGHPFSFSAIINGYRGELIAESGWPGIRDYLERRSPDEFGFSGVRVTHAWTQDESVTTRLCRACKIDHAVGQPEDLIGAVDAVIIARDDSESHHDLAMPFLHAGLPVFVDKPLTLKRDELDAFHPYLAQGRLMSCSGLRFCRELDDLRTDPFMLGALRLVQGNVVNGWAKYGIHMLDAVLGATGIRPVAVRRLPAEHDSLALEMTGGALMTVNALGEVPGLFQLSFHGATGSLSVDLLDNFTAFRRTLEAFIAMVKTGRAVVPPDETCCSVSTIIAGCEAQAGGSAVIVPDMQPCSD